MLNLFHANQENSQKYHRYPFVYLDGEAEEMNSYDFQAPDICVGDIPLDDVFNSNTVGDTKEVECTVNGKPAIAVFHNMDNGIHGFIRKGRVALASDTASLKHCRSPETWC